MTQQSISSLKDEQKAAGSNALLFSRDEMNLAEFPLAVLSTRVNTKVKTLEFSDTHRAPTGEMVERKWIITGADKFGLPTATDDDVVLGLMRLSMEKGFRERKVYFTRYELLQALRWSTEGRSYQRLIKSLDRLSGVRIRSTNSFYDNKAKAYQTCNFGVIDSYEINDSRKPDADGKQPKSYFVWSEMLFDSFKAGYIKKLDLELYFSLSSATSRRIYRYLDKHFYYRRKIERPLMQLAFEKIGLSRSYKYVSSVKQQLEPALDELVESGFLGSYEFKGRGKAAKICFIAAGEMSSISTQAESFKDSDASKELVALLVTRGMAKLQASRLIAQQPKSRHERVKKIVEYYDQLVATGDFKVSKNRVGFLYRAVERADEFQLPEETAGKSVPRGETARLRPELKIFKAEKTPGTAGGKTKRGQGRGASSDTSAARGGFGNPKTSGRRAESAGKAAASASVSPQAQLGARLSALSATEVAQLYSRVEEKLSCLKPVLSAEKYSEAVSACILKELE